MSFSKKGLKHFKNCESGSATIEFVLWLPLMAALLSITTDAALILGNKANVLRVVQDANRAASVGRFRTEAEAEAYVMSNIGALATNATIDATIDPDTRVISTTVVIPTNDMIATGMLGKLSGLNVTIQAQHFLEI